MPRNFKEFYIIADISATYGIDRRVFVGGPDLLVLFRLDLLGFLKAELG